MARKYSVTRGSKTKHYNTRAGAVRGAKASKGTFHRKVNKRKKGR